MYVSSSQDVLEEPMYVSPSMSGVAEAYSDYTRQPPVEDGYYMEWQCPVEDNQIMCAMHQNAATQWLAMPDTSYEFSQPLDACRAWSSELRYDFV